MVRSWSRSASRASGRSYFSSGSRRRARASASMSLADVRAAVLAVAVADAAELPEQVRERAMRVACPRRRDEVRERVRIPRALLPSTPSSRAPSTSPMPGMSMRMRYQLTSSRGFSETRRKARTSFTCAASRNLRPPHFSNGILRFVELDLEIGRHVAGAERARPSRAAACRLRAAASMRSTTNRVCCASSFAVTSHGFSPPSRFVQRSLREPLLGARDERCSRRRGSAASSGSSARA